MTVLPKIAAILLDIEETACALRAAADYLRAAKGPPQ